MNPWIIYLWGIADQVRSCLGITASFAVIATLVMYVVVCTARSDAARKKRNASTYNMESYAKEVEAIEKAIPGAKRQCRFLAVASVFLVLVATLMPNSKTIALMVVVPAVMNSEPIQKDLPELYQMAKEALKQTLETK
jgi:hypothetical protein